MDEPVRLWSKLGSFTMHPVDANRLARICAYSAEAPQWDQFVRQITPIVAVAARRVCAVWGDSSHATVSEIIQEVYLRLCEEDRRVLREFEDRGNESFLKLLRVITASVATDYFRRVTADKRGGRMNMSAMDSHEESPVASASFSKAAAVDAIERPALIAQLDGLLLRYPDEISERDRTLFWLYYRQGLTADAISRIPAIELSAKGVESAIGRISRHLRAVIVSGKPPAKPLQFLRRNGAELKGFSTPVAVNSMKQQ